MTDGSNSNCYNYYRPAQYTTYQIGFEQNNNDDRFPWPQTLNYNDSLTYNTSATNSLFSNETESYQSIELKNLENFTDKNQSIFFEKNRPFNR